MKTLRSEGKAWALQTIQFTFGLLIMAAVTSSFAADEPYRAPRWSLELKGGQFEPDLEFYEQFYGDDQSTYWAVNGAYRFNNWVELGAELGYSRESGQGALGDGGSLGGKVDYTLMPLSVYVNLRYDRSFNQLFVPYIGAGLVTAWYRQEIDQQANREGRADFGGAARAGLQLLLNRLDPRGADAVRDGERFKALVFIEAQTFATEIDGIDLGGQNYLLGLRFEFD